MFNSIWNAIESEGKIHDMRSIISHMADLMEVVEDAVVSGKDSKNVIIDAICQILQSHKD